MEALLDGLEWARPRTDVNCGLRRGAWYRVIRRTDEAVILDVNRTPVSVRPTIMEIVRGLPRRWSVVARPLDATRLPSEWGDHYATCPGCRNRARIRGHPVTMRCPRCAGVFSVGWDEINPSVAP